jgi:hypothetical protein
MNRRKFFSLIAGACAGLALAWKAKAQPKTVVGTGAAYAPGVRVSIYGPMEPIVWPDPELAVRKCAAEMQKMVLSNPDQFPEGYASLRQCEDFRFPPAPMRFIRL